MDKAEILDRLNRACEMEESMVGMLVDLCQPDALSAELPAGIRTRISTILIGLKEESLRHKKMVLEIKDAIR